MIRKRRSLSSARKGKTLHREAASVRRRRRAEVLPVYQSVDKHELILAHAEARQRNPPSSRGGVVVAISVSALIVCIGWFVTFGASLQSLRSSGDGLWDSLRGQTARLQDDLEEPAAGAKGTLNLFEANRASREAVLKQVAEEIQRRQVSSTEDVAADAPTSTHGTSTGR